MRHDPASAAVVVMLRSLKMYGMAQAADDLIEQGAPAFGTAVPILSQLLKAEVAEFIYMGDIFRTRLRVAGRDDFIIKTRNAPDQRRLQPGEQIEIGWLPEDCRALDAP